MLKKSLSLILFIFMVLCLQGQPFLQTLWSESYDISYPAKTEILVPLADGSVILGGSGVSPTGGVNVQLIKVSSAGSILWQKVYSGEGDQQLRSVSLTSRNEILLAAMTSSENYNIWIAKLDASGGIIWDMKTGGSYLDQACCILESPDGGNVLVAGAREVQGDRDTDAWLTGLDKKGKLYMQGMFGERYTNQVARAVIRVAEGNYLIGGSSQAAINAPEIPYLFQVDMRLNKIWDRTFPDFKDSRIESLYTDQDGLTRAFISIHAADGSQTGTGLLVISRSGDLLEKFICPAPFVCRENTYARLEDGQFVMINTPAGPASSLSGVVKLDKKLQTVWQKQPGQDDTHPLAVARTGQGTFLLAAWSGEMDPDKPLLEATSFRDMSDELVKNYVSGRMNEWKVRKEGESEDKYQERLAGKNEKQLMTEFTLDAKIHYQMIEAPSVKQENQVAATEPSEQEQMTFRSGIKKDESINTGTYHALLIAVNDYVDPNINDLDQPVIDAGRLRDVLVNDYTFDEANVSFLKNPSREEIITVMDRLEYSLDENDNLLIFYAGHGYWDENTEKGYWLPSDAKQFNTSNWILNSTIHDYIRGIKSKHTLLIADACFGGSIFKTRSAFGNQAVAISRLNELPSRKGMTSGTLTQVPDKSIFVEYLVKRLAENEEKYLPSEQLFYSFKPAVLNNSENIPQFGEIHSAGDEGGDFIFVRKR